MEAIWTIIFKIVTKIGVREYIYNALGRRVCFYRQHVLQFKREANAMNWDEV